MEKFEITIAEFKNGKPTWYKAIFKDKKYQAFSSNLFESEEIANLGAQLFELSGYNYDLWLRLFAPTLRMWGIQCNWTL